MLLLIWILSAKIKSSFIMVGTGWQSKWGSGVRGELPQRVSCAYSWEMGCREGTDGWSLQDSLWCPRGHAEESETTCSTPHHSWREWWRQMQTVEELIKNTSICNRWFISAESEWSWEAIQICGKCICNLYLKHRPDSSCFACMPELFLMWNYLAFTSQVWFKLCIDQWFVLN